MVVGRRGVDIGKMESIGPTTSLLILAPIMNHNPDPLEGIDINLEVCRGFGESDKLEIGEYRRVLQIQDVLR